MIKAVIIDDEQRAINVLGKLISHYCPDLQLVGTAADTLDAIELIRNQKPEVIFIDVEMHERNAFQLLEQFERIDFEIIFVTAHSEYAIRAFRFSAFDYLMKPVCIDDLCSVARRLVQKHEQKHMQQLHHHKKEQPEANPLNKIVLGTANGFYFVQLSDIIYCEADENYTHIFMEGQVKHTASKPLKEFVDLFQEHNFFRIHKSYLVNLNKITFINKDCSVIMNNRKELPVSFRKRTEFFNYLKCYSVA